MKTSWGFVSQVSPVLKSIDHKTRFLDRKGEPTCQELGVEKRIHGDERKQIWSIVICPKGAQQESLGQRPRTLI